MVIGVAKGVAAGLLATAGMSVVLGLADRCGLMSRQPPRKIVETFLPPMPDDWVDALAVAAHLGYGVAAGATYELLIPRRAHNGRTGILFGITIWALGYEGWLPALGILPPAHRDNRGRAVTMIAAHLVYGWILGRGSEWLRLRDASRQS